jgi:phenylacetate-CoA ligase
MSALAAAAYAAPKIDRILRHACAAVPYYRGFDGASFKEFPLITKVDYRARFEQFVSTDLTPGIRARILAEVERASRLNVGEQKEVWFGDWSIERSSGTTGPAVWYPRSRLERCHLSFAVARARRRYFSGYSAKTFIDLTEAYARGLLPREITADAARESFVALSTQGYKYLYGTLGLLSGFVDKLNESNCPQAYEIVEVAGEYLDSARAIDIERAFRCTVLNQYGCRETWAIGYAMGGQDEFEVLPDVVVELVDEQGLAINESGVAGMVVVTSGILETMPIIRFVTGDFAAWKDVGDTRLLVLEDERANAKLRWYEGGPLVSGTQTMKTLINSVISPTGRQVVKTWRITRRDDGYYVYLHPDDRECENSIRAAFSSRSELLGTSPVHFVEWAGWSVGEKRILYVDKRSRTSVTSR